MRAEQACRFATKESGYRISAKSPGFQATSGDNLANAFNQSMNGLFPKLGQSLVSLSISGGDVFLAKLTMRTDIRGRASLFTNAVAVPLDQYRQLMRSKPWVILDYPMWDLLSSQPYTETLVALEIDLSNQPAVIPQEVMEKYSLTEQDLALFYRQLYSAVFSRGSLCLNTSCSFEEAMELSRDFSVLAVDGLLPTMRESFTFSSGGDTRNLLCVRSGDARGLLNAGGVEIFEFSADPGMRGSESATDETDIQSITDMLEIFFKDLAHCSEKERQSMLSFLDGEAEKYGRERGIREPGILLACYYDFRQRREGIYEAANLIVSFLSYMESVPEEKMDRHLIDLHMRRWLDIVADHHICLAEKISERLLDWALEEGDREVLVSLQGMLTLGKPEMRVSLAVKLLHYKYGGETAELVQSLLSENCAAWTPDFTEALFQWTCEYNIPSLSGIVWEHRAKDCCFLLRTLIDKKLKEEKEGILKGEKLFNDCEMQYLALCLKDLINHGEWRTKKVLTEEEIRLVNREYPKLPSDLQQSWITYVGDYYLVGLSNEGARREFLRSMNEDEKTKEVFTDLDYYVKESQDQNKKDIFEDYEADKVLTGAQSCEELVRRSAVENNLSPQGPFETRLRRMWMDLMTSDFRKIRTSQYDDSGNKVKHDDVCLSEIANCYVDKYLPLIHECQISSATSHRLENYSCYLFWSQMRYAWLLHGLTFTSGFMDRAPEVRLDKRKDDFDHEIIQKKYMAAMYVSMLAEKEGTEPALLFWDHVIRDHEWSVRDFMNDFPGAGEKLAFEEERIFQFNTEEREEIRRAMLQTSTNVRNITESIPLDLLLLNCWSEKEGWFKFDIFARRYTEKFQKQLFHIDDRVDVEKSVLLSGPHRVEGLMEDLRRSLEKSKVEDPDGVLDALVDQLGKQKSSSGFFGELRSRLFRKKG